MPSRTVAKPMAGQQVQPRSRCPMRTRSPVPRDAAVTSRSRAILSRSPESWSGQANAAGGGRGWSQKKAAPHGRPGSGIAHWLGQPGVCVDRACPGRRCCAPVAAPAVPPPPALSALHLARRKGYRLPVLFFPFCLTAAASGGFPPRDFPSHVTPPFSAVKSRGRPAGVAGD